jgi:hypothetical protein
MVTFIPFPKNTPPCIQIHLPVPIACAKGINRSVSERFQRSVTDVLTPTIEIESYSLCAARYPSNIHPYLSTAQ